MEGSDALAGFYDRTYSAGAEEGDLYARWRLLSAIGKADHVLKLCRAGGLEPERVLEVGCGDGALLCELRRRGFGTRLSGLEITDVAVQIAAARPEIDSVRRYDGRHLPGETGSEDLGILCHVLEHVADPTALLRELARVCAAVLIEVPLEANVSARRPSKRLHGEEIGHLQLLDRSAMREIARGAGLRVVAELEDPLPLEVHSFFAAGPAAVGKARAKWALRSALHRLTPALARRLFTLHYACLCLPLDGSHPQAATRSAAP